MTGYTRADSVNNIADGNIINASDLDGEFDAVQAAFNNSTGHVHDGTAANGAPITKIGPTQDVVASAIALLPKTTATVDVGSSALKFKDFFFSGAGSVTGTITAGGFSGPLNGTVGATTPAAGTFTSLTDSGNLTFTGTGNRITGDFSNATASNRVIFQTSTASSNTRIGMMPSSASTGTAGPVLYSTNDPNNASVFDIRITDGVQASLQSTFNGTGSNLPMTFYTGGSERMRLDTSGNVGIGTASPSYKLDVSGTFRATGLSNFDNAISLNTATLNYLYYTSALSLSQTGTGERMRIDSSGNVGIGTASPSYKLDVAGVVRGTGNIISGDGSAFVFGTGVTSYVSGSSTSNVIDFYTSSTARMRIDSSGNVGIGTSAPTQKLDVVGGSGTIAVWDNTALSAGNGGAINLQANNGTAARATYAQVKGFVTDGTTGAEGGSLVFKTIGSGTLAERMRIDSGGNVGIGTSSPSTYSSVYKTVNAIKINDQVTTIGSYYQVGVAQYGFINVSDAVGTTATSLVFSNGSNVERMRIDSAGNVGIGTASPAQKLDVVGSGKATSSFAVGDSSGNLSGSMLNESDVSKSITFNADPANVGTSSFMRWNVDGTERMRLDSSGNVGIGTSSPSTYVSGGGLALQGTYGTSSAAFSIYNNSGASASNIAKIDFKFNNTFSTNSPSAAIWALNPNAAGNNGGALVLATSANGTDTTPTERMRIDSSGNVGIGTSSPGAKLDVSSSGQNTVVSRSTGGYAAFQRIAPTGQQTYDFYTINGVEVARITGDPSYLSFATGSTGAERMRIDSSGNLLVGQTAVGTQNLNSYSFNVSTGAIAQNHITGTGSGASYTVYAYAGTVIGSVTQSGTTAVLYNTTSDQRLKENIQDANSASALIDALQVRQFDWKSDNSHQRYGFVAQELVTVAPEAVHQPTDSEEMMAVDYSKLVPMLVKEIQSLRKRLADAGIA